MQTGLVAHDQTVGLQTCQRLPHRSARDAVQLGETLLAEPFRGPDRTGDQIPAQLRIDLLAKVLARHDTPGQIAMAARTSASESDPPTPVDVIRPASRM